jgi:murein DD-endopeptidase MepM/ murein hydrolase activator NlpD
MNKLVIKTGVIISLGACIAGAGFVSAHSMPHTTASGEIAELNSEIEEKELAIDQLNRQIEQYKNEIAQKQSEEQSLQNDLDILENRIKKTELDIEAVNTEIDLVNTEIAVVESEITDLEHHVETHRKMIADVLREIQIQDRELSLELIFGTDSFSEFFDTLEQLESVSTDLKSAVDVARDARDALVIKQNEQETKKDQLEDLEDDLKDEQRRLDQVLGAKETLIVQTQQSESEYWNLLNQVREEQAFVNQQIAILQNEIEGKIDDSDELGDSTLLSWPVSPTDFGISAYFHDPTYPFRHLFEHSGIDLPAYTGTPIKAAAPGYVAWARTGRLYGNYVMIIHANGVSTLYAHMSRMDVVPDQFVSRGETIGAIGSTGLSTGPHLHFEVRKNGIPTNPLNYLVSY